MNPADMLNRALEQGYVEASTSAYVRALLRVADEVGHALSTIQLSQQDHDRIYARSLALLADALGEQRRGWQRVLHVESPAPVLVGGAAALTLGAAIGVLVIRARRPHATVAA